LSWQNLARDDMKSSPCSNATANVCPDFISLVLMSILRLYVVVGGIPLGGIARLRESLPDMGAVGFTGDQQVQ
jgi:hypothetical protein